MSGRVLRLRCGGRGCCKRGAVIGAYVLRIFWPACCLAYFVKIGHYNSAKTAAGTECLSRSSSLK
jgi:hypothetical protein